METACKVHGCKVFSDIRSISSWSQSESAILSYNPDVRSARFVTQGFLLPQFIKVQIPMLWYFNRATWAAESEVEDDDVDAMGMGMSCIFWQVGRSVAHPAIPPRTQPIILLLHAPSCGDKVQRLNNRSINRRPESQLLLAQVNMNLFIFT